jgi:photosystem II stability/assembly factor-like uncharacterized protein
MKTLKFFAVVFFIIAAVRVYGDPVLNQNDIKFESVSTATVVGQDGLIMRTENGGLNWQIQDAGITNVLNAMDFISYGDVSSVTETLLIAVGENGVILKSTDNGTTWNIKTNVTTENLNDIAIYSPDLIYICGNNGTLLRSVDLGETFELITVPVTTNLNSITFSGPQTVVTRINAVIAGDSGTILVTPNAYDWTQVNSGTSENLYAITFSGVQAICTGANGTIVTSNDDGQSWIPAVSGVTSNIYDVKYLSTMVAMASSENGLMLRTEDGGVTWTPINTPVEADLFAVNFANDMVGISTGSEGTEIYSIDGGLTWSSAITNSVLLPATRKQDINLSQNYPNPFNPVTNIDYMINDNSNVSIKIYDMTGREVRTLVNSFQSAGTYSVRFDAMNISSGIYFYVLRVNSGRNEITKTMRMILTK